MSDHSTTHPNYVKIWALLLGLLIVSVLGPLLGWKIVTLVTAFGIAAAKAWIVATNFMHLRTEVKIASLLLLAALVLLAVLFFGLASDVMNSDGQQWRLLAPDQSATAPAINH